MYQSVNMRADSLVYQELLRAVEQQRLHLQLQNLERLQASKRSQMVTFNGARSEPESFAA